MYAVPISILGGIFFRIHNNWQTRNCTPSRNVILPIIPQPVRLLESAHYSSLYIGCAVEDFATYLNVRQDAIVSIILQSSSAHFQDVSDLFVCQQFIVERSRLSALK